MASLGNLPSANNVNPTTEYFNNFFTSEAAVSQNVNDAITGYFQTITNNVETGKTLAATVIYTALSQGIDPMSLLDDFKKLSDKNKLENISNAGGSNTNANVHVVIVPGTTYTDSVTILPNVTILSSNNTTQTIKVNLLGKADRAVVTGYEITGTLTGNAVVSGNITLINNTSTGDGFVAQSNVVSTYGTFNITSAGHWNYTRTVSSLPLLQEYTDSLTVNRASDNSNTQKISVIIDNNDRTLSLTKIQVEVLDSILPSQIVGKINFSNLIPQSNSIGTNKFGKFTVDATGLWYYVLNPFPILDPKAIKGPNPRENNLSEIDAYLTVLLNTNRVNTSLLGISNSPPVNKYIQRAILP